MDGESTLKTLTQMVVVVPATPAGETHVTFVDVTYCDEIGPIEPNEHTAELSMIGTFVPVIVIRVPPISPLVCGETVDADGTPCRESGYAPSPPSIDNCVDTLVVEIDSQRTTPEEIIWGTTAFSASNRQWNCSPSSPMKCCVDNVRISSGSVDAPEGFTFSNNGVFLIKYETLNVCPRVIVLTVVKPTETGSIVQLYSAAHEVLSGRTCPPHDALANQLP